MNNESRVNKAVEETLNSLEGIQRAEPRPFFYTRLAARMQPQPAGAWERTARFLSRPAIAMACIFLVLLANGLALLNKSRSAPAAATEIQSEDFAYETANMNATAVLYEMDNNTEP